MDSQNLPVLAVDLDGTLLRSNMLHETFWSAFGKAWSTPLRMLPSLLSGRSQVKHFLSENSEVDVTLLPYSQEVIDYVAAWRSRGGRTALVTATNMVLANRIADHLALFDEVIGSEQTVNLKGPIKAKMLCDRYGAGNFAYVGDSPADLAVWPDAAKVIACAPGSGLAAKVRRNWPDAEIIGHQPRPLKAYIKAIRVHQWAKNILVFLPMVGAHQFDLPALLAGLLAFVAFSLIASSVYVLNDLLDLSSDRRHARKKLRPFASGAIPIEHGMPMWLGLFAAGLFVGSLLGWGFLAVLLAYLVITTAYSFYLKQKVIVDICTLAGLYTIRIAAGAVAVGVPLSMWMLAFSLFLFFSLAAVKRHAELVHSNAAGKQWTSGRGYSTDDLHIVSQMAISSGYVSVLVLALYINSSVVTRYYGFPELLWGVCPVLLYWISRMSMVASRGNMHDDPIVFAATDRISLGCLALMGLFVIASTNMFGLSPA